MTFGIGSSSGAGGSGFLSVQPVKSDVMVSRLLDNQQEGFKSPFCPHSEYQNQDSGNIGASGDPQRRELEHSRSILNITH